MKKNITPTNNEYTLSESEQIITKTDLHGVLKYCNPKFIEFSGYKESELLGKPHNIIRHPDMPRVMFHLMWENLKANREFNGYIKNICRDGSYYWVFANVTPSMSPTNELLGYYSVRRKPNEEALEYIKNLYIELLEIEKQHSKEEAIEASLYKLHSVLNGREVGYDEFILTI